jgi:hypothetical protein
MNDESINFVILMLMIFAFMAVMRGRRLGRRQRDMQRTIDHLQSVQSAPPPAMLPGASKEQVQRLEERVRVLERIVTDNGYALASQIEALRDQPADKATAREREGTN